MALILGIETSCDETAAAIYDSSEKKLLSNVVFSQVALHEKYGGVVPEIASRSHLEKVGFIVRQSLSDASLSLPRLDYIAVTSKPGLAGALLVGLCFAKGLAYAHEKKLIAVDHLEAHIFSSFLMDDGSVKDDLKFPHICLVASGGHTSLYLVRGFGDYELIGQTLDDAAGEAFDKIAKLIGLGYPGGPRIEKFAQAVAFQDFFQYPRTKNLNKTLHFSFSGLKTAVLYDLVKRGVYDLKSGIISNKMTDVVREQVSSSLLVCIADIIKAKVSLAMMRYPEAKGVTFVGGVACNSFLREQLQGLCDLWDKQFVVPPKKYCGDNAAMVSFVGSYKAGQEKFSGLTLDVYE
ncbi:tRNA (adenosine(37)-N6)-threonylcarbamoyltransferase complex transferase subunit TsaD [Candidatus Dependentiae bacterium]|nr:tRNA (adenosine(37)-N6)-threonylcarbamoyltransferase complex transferase subunit TsaD [Candidatus Dependentiae bacterium]